MAESSPVGGESESENVELLPRRRSACNWGVLSSPASSSDQLLLGGKSSSQTQPTHLNFSTFFSFFFRRLLLCLQFHVPCPLSTSSSVFIIWYPASVSVTSQFSTQLVGCCPVLLLVKGHISYPRSPHSLLSQKFNPFLYSGQIVITCKERQNGNNFYTTSASVFHSFLNYWSHLLSLECYQFLGILECKIKTYRCQTPLVQPKPTM